MTDPSQHPFPPVRACIFDMDGLLIDSEDLYSVAINTILAEYSRPPMPWGIKAQLQGRPVPEAAKIFSEWAKLPISVEEFREKQFALQQELFQQTKPLPGVVELLNNLTRASTAVKAADGGGSGSCVQSDSESAIKGPKIELALATSSHTETYTIKTKHPSSLFNLIPNEHKVLGDDPRVAPGRGKPLPDIYLLALATINKTLGPTSQIKPEECLVFEDSVPGVEAGRRAGMRVVWCPYPGLLEHYRGREKEVLAGITGEHRDLVAPNHGKVGALDDGFADLVLSLEDFSYENYGISIWSPIASDRV
ncbi:uncharacterized protein A1O5_07298 [Cladophialophora psammophila CBS 110553]|uniref:HAD superfamily hydrolase n=1 Tax=Cladophialophora psammophila CBS 110553 TaxID=1182543 RepID=W9WM64_9EURO|nr:uncharacterized protein A1O5_07298 [Cladophialophora psammophila CBS 110553]EXJ69262.1 hypothetical protein A1O5_07298 [Cladophialophora psammophila CBS 110553]